MKLEGFRIESDKFSIDFNTSLFVSELINNETFLSLLKQHYIDNKDFVEKIESLSNINEYYRDRFDRLEHLQRTFIHLELMILGVLNIFLVVYIYFN